MHFSTQHEQEYMGYIAAYSTFAASRYPNDSLHAHKAFYYCQICDGRREQYIVDSFATVIAQRCLGCKYMWINRTRYSKFTEYHMRLVARAWKTAEDAMWVIEKRDVPRGER